MCVCVLREVIWSRDWLDLHVSQSNVTYNTNSLYIDVGYLPTARKSKKSTIMERALWGNVWLNTLHSHWCQSSGFPEGVTFRYLQNFCVSDFFSFSYFWTKAKQSLSVQLAEVVTDESTKVWTDYTFCCYFTVERAIFLFLWVAFIFVCFVLCVLFFIFFFSMKEVIVLKLTHNQLLLSIQTVKHIVVLLVLQYFGSRLSECETGIWCMQVSKGGAK